MAERRFSKRSARQTPFVGRAVEIRSLRERLSAARRGEGALVLVHGEPGIGKTRLLAEIEALARDDGWLVLSGRAYDTEGMPPYLPFIEALRQYSEAAPGEQLTELLQGIPMLVALIPGLQRSTPQAVPLQPLPPDAERLRVFDAISGCFLRVAASGLAPGVLLALDDLHWADRSTLQLLVHLARKLTGTPLLVLGTYRGQEAGPSTAISETLAALSRERLDGRIALGSLSEDEIAVLIASIGGIQPSAPVVHAVRDHTRGNPFFVEEVVRQLVSEQRDLTATNAAANGWRIPDELQQVIDARLAKLSPDARRVLQAASVIGDSFSMHFLREVCQLPDEALVAGLEALAAIGVIREEESSYAFAHPLVRDVVYNGVSLARRQNLHSRAAEALQANGAAATDEHFALVGHHWRKGGRPERAIEVLLQAGDAAIILTAWTEAAEHWLAALDCMDQAGSPPLERARLLEALGDLYFVGTFEAATAVSLYERAIPLYEAAGDPSGVARTHSKAGRCLAYPAIDFDAPAALEHIRAAHQIIAAGQDTFELGELLFALAHVEQHALRAGTQEVLQSMERLESIAEKLDSGFLRVAATSLRGHYLLMEGHLAEGISLEARACEEAEALVATGGNLWPLRWREDLRSSVRGTSDVSAESSAQIARFYPGFLRPYTINCCGLQSLDLGDPLTAKAKHERIRDPRGRFMSPFLMFDLFLAGEVESLRQCCDPENQLLSPIGGAKDYGSIMLSWCDGRWEDVAASLEAFAARLRSAGSDSMTMFADRWLTRLYRVNGDAARMGTALKERVATATRCGAVKFEVQLRAEVALIDAESGRLEEAERQLARCRDIMAAGEDWLGIGGRVALAEAVSAAARRRNEDAEGHFERAIDTFRSMTLPWDEAETYELWARAGARFLRGRNRRAFVSEKVDAARLVYERIGAGQPWLNRVDAEQQRLLASGGIERETFPDGLTVREADVLRLIAAGHSNREIAEVLVLSLRTVERHITNIYAKIGARGRADATSYALRESLT